MPQASSPSVRIFWPARDSLEIAEALRDGIARLAREFPLVRAVLFGSHASGRATVASDVDVLIVYRGDRRPDDYALAKRIVAVPRLEPHLYTEAESARLAPTLERMTRGGVALFPRKT